jgi:hypothetical protein
MSRDDRSQTATGPEFGEWPVIGALVQAGPGDRGFDVLMLCGPLLVALIALGGRTLLTSALVAAYLMSFVGYVFYRWFRGRVPGSLP